MCSDLPRLFLGACPPAGGDVGEVQDQAEFKLIALYSPLSFGFQCGEFGVGLDRADVFPRDRGAGEEWTICTAVAPEAVVTVRVFGCMGPIIPARTHCLVPFSADSGNNSAGHRVE